MMEGNGHLAEGSGLISESTGQRTEANGPGKENKTDGNGHIIESSGHLMEGNGEGEEDVNEDRLHMVKVRRHVLEGSGHANGPGTRGVGLHSLTPELLRAVIKALPVGDIYDESRDAVGNELLPLRFVSKAFRDAVDSAIVGHCFTIKSENRHDGSMLLTALRGFRRSLSLWPHLADLRLKFDWSSDYLHVALGTVADACPSLRRIYLELKPQIMWDEDRQPCLMPLAALTKLERLDLKYFQQFPRWSEGLSSLLSLTELHTSDQGSFDLEPLPSLQHLNIQPVFPETPSGFRGPFPVNPGCPQVNLAHLAQATNLREVYLYDVSIDSLTIPPGCSTLTNLILDQVIIQRGLEGGLVSLLGGPSPLPSLHDLFLSDVPVPVNLSLAACTALVFLSLRHLPRLRSLSGLLNPRHLTSLHLDTLLELRELPSFGPGPPPLKTICLHHLDKLEHLPALTSFPELSELTLSNLKRVTHAPGLSELAHLVTLKIEACLNLNLPEAALATLHNLESLWVTGDSQLQVHPPLKLALPDHPALSKLHTLTVGFCSVPPRGLKLVGHHKALTSLTLTHIGKLSQLPYTLRELPSLTQLTIAGCPELKGIELLGLHSLQHLTLKALNYEKSLPELSHLVALEALVVEGFPILTTLGDFRGNVKLQEVTVGDCPNLRAADFRGAPSICKVSLAKCNMLLEVKLAALAQIDLTECPSLRHISQ